MFRQPHFYTMLLLVFISGCSPGIYIPATPNIPMVDSTYRTEIKAGFSFRHIELQGNRLLGKSTVMQVQLSQRFASYRYAGGRYETGVGKIQNLSNSASQCILFGAGYSFIRYGSIPTRYSEGNWFLNRQIPFYMQYAFTKSWPNTKWLFGFRPSLVYVPYTASINPFDDPLYDFENIKPREYRYKFYSVMDCHVGMRMGPSTFMLGTKFPLHVSHPFFKELQLVEEYLYLRLTFNLNKPR